LNSSLRVIVEFDFILIFFEILLVTKSLCDLLVSLILLTFGITFDKLFSTITSTRSLDVPSQVTLAVKPYLCLAWYFRARLVRMARCLASVNTIFFDFIASHTASISELLFLTDKAFTRQVTILHAIVTTGKRLFALSSAAQVAALVAEDACLQLFTTVAEALNHNKTGRAVTTVTLKTAVVSARQLFQARSVAGWSRLTAFDGRIKFGDIAGAPEWLIGDILALVAVAQVTEVRTRMDSTR